MKKIILIFVLHIIGSFSFYAQGGVGINNTGVNPNPNAMLDVNSDTKGVLITRLTTIARITLGGALAIADNGMLVYDKDLSVFYYWDGSQWILVGNGTGSDNQNLTGASLTGTSLQIDIQNGTSTTVDLASLQDGVNDADADPTNEIQTISILVDTISLSNGGGSVTLPLSADGDAWAVAGEDVISAISRTGDVAVGGISDPSAVLNLESVNKGFLITRSNPLNITAPSFGLMTLNPIDSCLYMYSGTTWILQGGVGSSCAGNCSVAPNAPAVISGNTSICANSLGEAYSINSVSGATSYTWSLPTGASIVSGQGTSSIIVNFGSTSGNITVTADNTCGSSVAQTLTITLLPITGTQIFAYTGADQTYTIPSSCASFVKIQCWGAAAGNWSTTPSSGAGGYSEAVFDLSTSILTPGQTISVMVGAGGANIGPNSSTPNNYGFGGGAKTLNSTGAAAGGGLSGVFTGVTPILVSDNARSVIIAGGGGGTGEDDCFSTNFRLRGGSGNDVINAGGMPAMQGKNGNNGSGCGSGGYGGGGGGFNGGTSQNRSGGSGLVFAGNGGTGYVHASGGTTLITFSPEFSGTPPSTTDVNYDGLAGAAPAPFSIGGNGLVVISFY